MKKQENNFMGQDKIPPQLKQHHCIVFRVKFPHSTILQISSLFIWRSIFATTSKVMLASWGRCCLVGGKDDDDAMYVLEHV